MRSRRRRITILLTAVTLITTLTPPATARTRDPLTQDEINQLKEVAADPGKRLHLYIQFAETRLANVDQLRSNTAADRGKKIHDLLEDFTAILDEINDNLDTYEGRPLSADDRQEFRRGLKEVIEATDRYDLKLKALKAAAESDPRTKQVSVDFKFVLQDAIDALKSTNDMAHEYLIR